MTTPTTRTSEPGTGSTLDHIVNDHRTGIAGGLSDGARAAAGNPLLTPEQDRARRLEAETRAAAEAGRDAAGTEAPAGFFVPDPGASEARPRTASGPARLPQPASPIDQVLTLLADAVARQGGRRLDPDAAAALVEAMEGLTTHRGAAGEIHPLRFGAAVADLLDLLKTFPDSRLSAAVGAAVMSTVAQIVEARPELSVPPGIAADLADLAAALDAAAGALGVDFPALLRDADNLENLWTTGGPADRWATETAAGDVDFARLHDPTATALAQRILGDAYIEPGWAREARAAEAAPAGAEGLLAALMADPRFAALMRIIELGMRQKENAEALLASKSGALDEKTMAIYTEANRRADQLITTATNIQTSNHDLLDTLARNVG